MSLLLALGTGNQLTGSVILTEQSDGITASGQIIISGTQSSAEIGTDSPTISGKVVINGSIQKSESSNDTIVSQGLIAIHGQLSPSEQLNDTLVATGTVKTVSIATITITESVDSSTAIGSVVVRGNITKTEPNDSIQSSAVVKVSGTILSIEPTIDSIVSLAKVKISGGISNNELPDSLTAIGKNYITGLIQLTELSDSINIFGKPVSIGTIVVTEESIDQISSFGHVNISGEIVGQELADISQIVSQTIVTGVASTSELHGDTISILAKNVIVGSSTISEQSFDTSHFSANVVISSDIVAIESDDICGIFGFSTIISGAIIGQELADSCSMNGFRKDFSSNKLDKHLNTSYPNFLGQNAFKFELDRIPIAEFFGEQINLPMLNIVAIDASTPMLDYPVIGAKNKYQPLRFKFLVDENLLNYSECIEWMYGIYNPENLTNNKIYSEKSFREYMKQSVDKISTVYSDGYLHILNSNNNENRLIKFHDMFPTHLSGLQLESTVSDIDYITCEVVFEYSYYTYE